MNAGVARSQAWGGGAMISRLTSNKLKVSKQVVVAGKPGMDKPGMLECTSLSIVSSDSSSSADSSEADAETAYFTRPRPNEETAVCANKEKAITSNNREDKRFIRSAI